MADLTAMMQAAAGAGGDQATFIEDVFSTYLYTGNGSTQTITNDIDLDGEGGLVWIKCRNQARDNCLFDTVRGATKFVQSNNSDSEVTTATSLTAFNSNGFSLGSSLTQNASTDTFCSWTFREQAKFFDIVTYTGTGVARTVAHNLGSVPGCIMVKITSTTGNWMVYHRANTAAPETEYLKLNSNDSTTDLDSAWNDTAPTDTEFTVGDQIHVNASGATYVAYLFAHDAGGFGTAGTDNVISCGSFTTDGSGNATVSLGYEPQYLMFKVSSTTGNWFVLDNMREWSLTNQNILRPNLSDVEFSASWGNPTATGFTFDKGNLAASATFIYMAIRRPMKVPTDATTVFSPVAYAGAGIGTTYTTNFPVDNTLVKSRNATGQTEAWDRLRGTFNYLFTDSTAAEGTAFGTTPQWLVDRMTSVKWNAADGYTNSPGTNYVAWNFKRASGFFDTVCYTGTGSATTQAHNLTVVPELIIVKRRSATEDWAVYSAPVGNTSRVELNTTSALTTSIANWNDTSPTASVFSIGTSIIVNGSGNTYVAYLFATLAGVSKVGSYTGTAAAQTINCGFTGGARFVLIKRTDSTGDWYVWDTARGIVSGNDPYLLLNSDAAEVTNTDYIDPASSGFEISSTAPAAINASGGSFIFLAIA